METSVLVEHPAIEGIVIELISGPNEFEPEAPSNYLTIVGRLEDTGAVMFRVSTIIP